MRRARSKGYRAIASLPAGLRSIRFVVGRHVSQSVTALHVFRAIPDAAVSLAIVSSDSQPYTIGGECQSINNPTDTRTRRAGGWIQSTLAFPPAPCAIANPYDMPDQDAPECLYDPGSKGGAGHNLLDPWARPRLQSIKIKQDAQGARKGRKRKGK